MGLGIVLATALSAVVVVWILPEAQAQELLKASQCFKSRGIPKVAFDCNPNHMIKIQRAFHGISLRDKRLLGLTNSAPGEQCFPSPGQQFNNCTYCEGDCVDDSMNLVYDWSTCMGNTSCIRTVMQSYMPACPGKDKFSDYLQVEYQCIPRDQVIDICSNTQKWMSEGYLMSPNYPDHYPTEQDCLCKIQTDWNSKIVLSFYDLLLETRQGRCRADWLMLRQRGQKHRHCGAIMTGTKNVTSETNAITLQFHSDRNDNRTQNFQYFSRNLKGFWLYFRAEPDSSLQVSCRRLTAADSEVVEIWKDDADYKEVVSTKETLTDDDNMVADQAAGAGGVGRGGTVMGEDVTPSNESGAGKEKPGTGGSSGSGSKRRPEVGRENEVNKQSSDGGATYTSYSKLQLVLSLVLLKLMATLAS